MKNVARFILLVVLCFSIASNDVFAAKAKQSKSKARTSSSKKYAKNKKSRAKTAHVRTAKPSKAHKIDKFTLQTTNSEIKDNMLVTAAAYLGTRYRSGGTNGLGFDCSGFTSYVFSQYDVNLLRSSRAQYTQGIEVPKHEVKKGDLIFFKGRSLRGGVGHVGIVTGINDDNSISFIHSSCGNGVIYNTTNDSYYAPRFIGVKRVIDDDGKFIDKSKINELTSSKNNDSNKEEASIPNKSLDNKNAL